MPRQMLIILTTGAEDRGNRATLAFAMGVSALISGVETTIYMTMSGTIWSRRRSVESVHIQGFEALSVYVDQFAEAGGTVLVCSPCNDFYCSMAQEAPMMEGAKLAGLAKVVDTAMDASVVTL